MTYKPRPTDATAANQYELIIIGGGIAGGMLASAMARNGVNVLMLEGGIHPKFAIGESMILETSEIMRLMAMVFDVPELEVFSSEHFLPIAGTSHGVKRHFSFMPHKPGAEPNPCDLVQAVIPEKPYGHELHLYRQDTDYYYHAIATHYGAEIRQGQKVSDVITEDSRVIITMDDSTIITGDYVVDAGGYASILAQKKNLRQTASLQTHTRSIFTHMMGVGSYHQHGGSYHDLGIPFSLAEGTHHHVFEGGWLWVIPFNNHKSATNPLCSIGLLLDPRRHPEQSNLSAEEEFWDFVARYPSIKAHLDGAKPVRHWVRTGRIQYSSSQCVGDRFCLLGHAAGFIDPLFSKGLYTSLASIFSFGRAFLNARKNQDYGRARFLDVERTTLGYIAANDRLVANAIKCFAAPDLWRQYSVLWLSGAYLELVRLTTFRQELQKNCRNQMEQLQYPAPTLKLFGGGYPMFDELFDDISIRIEKLDINDEKEVAQVSHRIRDIILGTQWLPYSHRAIAAGARHLPKNKYSLRLLTRKGGLLGEKPYRDHFFRQTNPIDLTIFLMKDALRYSRKAIAYRHHQIIQRAL